MPLRFPVICGPTASGKTELGVRVALELGGGAPGAAEVVIADAFQVFRGLDIGTAKPTAEERRGVPHRLIDVVEPTESFSVARWLELARRALDDIRSRGLVPIVVGGTHLYVKALLDGLFEGPAPDPALRESLRATPQGERRRELERVDPAAAARLHPNDERRTIRALEVFRQTARPISELQRQWREGSAPAAEPDAALVVIERPAAELNRRINERVRSMMARGLLDEVRSLHETGRLGPQAREALGYKQLLAHRRGGCALDEAVERIKIETRRFAKNQRTWVRRLAATPGAIRIDAEDVPEQEWAGTIVEHIRTPFGGSMTR